VRLGVASLPVSTRLLREESVEPDCAACTGGWAILRWRKSGTSPCALVVRDELRRLTGIRVFRLNAGRGRALPVCPTFVARTLRRAEGEERHGDGGKATARVGSSRWHTLDSVFSHMPGLSKIFLRWNP
jgi:hypothetical protein